MLKNNGIGEVEARGLRKFRREQVLAKKGCAVNPDIYKGFYF